MSVLTDIFTSLANKIRSKLGTNIKYTPTEAINAIDDVYNKGVTDTKVGTAGTGDVLSGKTFTNSSSVGISGSMENLSTNNRYQHYSNNSTPTIIGDAGFFTTVYDKVSQSNLGDYFEIRYSGSPNKNASNNETGNGYISTNTLFALPSQTKTVSPTTSSQTVSPDSNKVLKSVTVNAISTQEKSITATTSQQTVTPDSGKYLTKVTVNAQSHSGTKEITAGTSTTTTDLTATHNNRYIKVNPTPSQEKTVTGSRSAQTVTPDSGKLLSKVTVNKYPDASGTYTPSGHGTALDMGATNNYRYVNTTNAYNAGRVSRSTEYTWCAFHSNGNGKSVIFLVPHIAFAKWFTMSILNKSTNFVSGDNIVAYNSSWNVLKTTSLSSNADTFTISLDTAQIKYVAFELLAEKHVDFNYKWGF